MGKKTVVGQKIFSVTGLSLEEYCTKFLFCNNKAFEHRLRRKRLYPNEVIFLCWHLNTPARELFGEDFLQNMMNHGQPGITQISEEVAKMYISNPALVDLLGSVAKVSNGISKVLPSLVSEIPALEKGEPAPEPSVGDGLFNDLPVSR